METLKLFIESRSCNKCSYRWEGYSHRPVNSDSIFQRNDLFVWLPAEVGYLVPRGEHIEVEEQLKSIGWNAIVSCPKCGSKKLAPSKYLENKLNEVSFRKIEINDLEKNETRWVLSESFMASVC